MHRTPEGIFVTRSSAALRPSGRIEGTERCLQSEYDPISTHGPERRSWNVCSQAAIGRLERRRVFRDAALIMRTRPLRLHRWMLTIFHFDPVAVTANTTVRPATTSRAGRS